MSRRSRFSLHNSLPRRADAWERFDLNPVRVDDGGAPSFGLSTVLVGPRLGDDGSPLELELHCDDTVVVLEAIEQRSESLSDGSDLTVGLFDVSHRLLKTLTCATTAKIRLAGSTREILRDLAPANRDNVRAFVEATSTEPSAGGKRRLASATA